MRRDRARIQIGRISPFGLLELSRQCLRPSISETTNVTCHHCGGLGSVRSIESSVLHILRGIEESTAKYKGETVKVRVPGNTAIYLLNQKRDALVEIEKKYELKLFLVDDDTLVPPNFEIEKLNTNAFFLSGTMIEKNSGHLQLACGNDYKDFDENKLLNNFENLKHVDHQGTHWPPSCIHKTYWDKIGGFGEEYNPGIGCDPDLNMKLWKEGVRIFKGISKFRVYHFASIVLRKRKKFKRNNGAKTFLMKWGISVRFFVKY